jgi:hypothetical protein
MKEFKINKIIKIRPWYWIINEDKEFKRIFKKLARRNYKKIIKEQLK